MAHAVLICLLLSVVAASADLQSDLEDVASHLPMKDIESIGKQYVASNPKFAARVRFAANVTHEELVKNFLATKEGLELVEYFNRRGIDIETIWPYMTKEMSVVNSKWLEPSTEEDAANGPAITGDIMADFKTAIRASDFFESIHQKMEASPEFANLVAALKDPEFRTRFYRSANSKHLFGFGNSAAVRGFWAAAFAILKTVFTAAISFFG